MFGSNNDVDGSDELSDEQKMSCDREFRMEEEFLAWYTSEKSGAEVAEEFEEKYGHRPITDDELDELEDEFGTSFDRNPGE